MRALSIGSVIKKGKYSEKSPSNRGKERPLQGRKKVGEKKNQEFVIKTKWISELKP